MIWGCCAKRSPAVATVAEERGLRALERDLRLGGQYRRNM